jgi:hypothetical protein
VWIQNQIKKGKKGRSLEWQRYSSTVQPVPGKMRVKKEGMRLEIQNEILDG